MTRHQQTAFAFLTITMLVLPGCGLARIQIGHSIAEQRIAGSPLGGLLGTDPVIDLPLDIDLDAETAARNTGPAQHVYLSSFSLAITPTAEPAGDSDDFDFLTDIDVFIEGPSGSSLPRARIASGQALPRSARSLSLDVEDVDLIEYLRQGARLSASASGTLPPDDVTYDGLVELGIEVL